MLKQNESGFYYCVKSYSYDNERGEGLFQLIQHYCCEDMNHVAYSYYSLIKDFMEKRYLLIDNISDKLFIDNTILQFLLPYYMIIVSEKTRNYFTGVMMFRIIFTKKLRGMQEFYIKCMLFNLQFFIDHIPENERADFFNLFNTYIQFLEENGYPISSYDFMDNYKKFGVNSTTNIQTTSNKHFSIEECKQSKKILFFSGWSGEKWNQTTSLTKALGGSETAVAYLSKNFPKDYEIYVSGDVEEETVDNIKYIHLFNLPAFFKENAIHTIIVSRYIGFLELFSQHLSFHKLYLWAHDTCFHAYGSNYLGEQDILKKWNSRLTNVVCLTEWHKKLFSDKYPDIKDKIVTINNGIINEMFTYPLNQKVPNRFVYTSCAERGLGRLLQLWPQILEKYPDAQLKISSYNHFPKNKEEEKMLEYIKQTPSIEHLGRLGRSALYELMSTSEVWLYPSYWPETSCITALEMLRSEVVCVYFPVAGLTNTMEDYGIPIKEGQELEVLFSITEEHKDVLRFTGRKYAERSTWAERAKVWSKMILSE
jgi:glycosyltransferase involved in cell wall biosynthesis